MYEAPKAFRKGASTPLVEADADARRADARPDGARRDALGGDLDAHDPKLRDGPEVRNAQILSRGEFATYFAAANIVGAVRAG